MKRRAGLLTLVAFACFGAAPQAQAVNFSVGDACATNGATTSANLSGQILICTSGAWALVSSSSTAFLGTTTGAANPQRSGDATTGLLSLTTTSVSIETGGVEALRITATGSVGIGTTAPAYFLDVFPSGTSVIARIAPQSWTGGVSTAELILGNTNHTITAAAGGGTTVFDASGVYFTGGNVGIGTTNPQASLEVGAETITAPPTYARAILNTNMAAANGSGSYESLLLSNGGTNPSTSVYGPSIAFKAATYGTTNSYSTGRILSYFDTSAGSNPSYAGAVLNLQYPTSDNLYATGLALRNGYVGIGTVNPAAPIDISGAFGSGAKLLVYGSGGTSGYQAGLGVNMSGVANSMGFFLGNSDSFTIDSATSFGSFPYSSYTNRLIVNGSSGNVGIGTTAPQVKFDLAGSVAAAAIGTEDEFHITRNLNSGAAYPQVAAFQLGTYTANSAGNGYGPSTRLDINLKAAANTALTGDTTVMTLQSNGNVGIGTTAPANRLDVSGGAAFGSYAGSAGISNGLAVSGAVGLGTSAGQTGYELTTAGGIYATQNSAAYAGVYALNATTTGAVATGAGAALYASATGTGNTSDALYATNSSASGYAGYFNGAVNVNGALTVTSCTGCGGAGGGALSALIAATTTNNIDNANWAQTWKWGTLSTQTALALTTSSMTTGTLLSLSNGSASATGNVLSVASSGNGYGVSSSMTGASNTGYAGYFSNTATTGWALAASGNSYFAGNVGIGVAAPTAVLSLGAPSLGLDILKLYQGGTNNDYGFGIASNQMQVLVGTAGAITFNQRSGSTLAETMRIDTNGKVGIGTSAPQVKFDLAGSVAAAAIGTEDEFHITRNLNNAVSYPQLAAFQLGSYAANSAGNGYGPSTRLDINLKAAANSTLTGDTNVMTLQSNGNVGIGTTAPGAPLEVDNTKAANTGYAGYFSNTATTANYGVYATTASKAAGYGVYSSITGFGNTGYAGYFTNTDTGAVNYALYASTSSASGYAGYFKGNVNVAGTLSSSNAALAGTTTVNNITITGTCTGCTTGATIPMSSLLAAATTNSIDSNNWAQTWKWGTLSTQTALTLTTSSMTGGTLLNLSDSSSGSAGIVLNIADAQTGTTYGVSSSLTGAGNTGYAGYFSNTSAAGWALNATGTSYFNGSVGIGTATPGAMLDVSGNVNVSTYTGGTDLGYLKINSGFGNSYVQNYFGTLYLSNNSYLTGAGSAYDAFNPASQIVIATSGINFNTTNGVYGYAGNSATYTTALAITTTGLVGIGTTSPAARLDVNGGIDIKGANGLSAPANDAAGGSLAVGGGALGSLASVTTGLLTAVGYQALNADTTGTTNTAVGYQALGQTSTGSGNTALGEGAGYAITGGSSNIAIGALAGSTTLTTGSSNILIGNGTDTPVSSSSNWLNIGNTIYGDMSGLHLSIGSATVNNGAVLDLSSQSSSLILPGNTSGTASRPIAGTNGMIRYNNDTPALEAYVGGTWQSILSGTATSSANVYLGSATTANPAIAGAPTSGFYTAGAGLVDVEIAGSNITEWSSTGAVITGTATAGSFIPTSSAAPVNGMYLPAANSLAFSTNGATALTITSTGSVGIGTTAPTRALAVVANGTNGVFNIQNTNAAGYSSFAAVDNSGVQQGGMGYGNPTALAVYAGSLYLASQSTTPLTFITNSLERLRITSTGSVGIGTTSPSDKMDVAGAIGITTTTATKPLNGLYSSTTNSLSVTTSGVNALTITSTGSLGIGTTSPNALLDLSYPSNVNGFRFNNQGTSVKGYITQKSNGEEIWSNNVDINDNLDVAGKSAWKLSLSGNDSLDALDVQNIAAGQIWTSWQSRFRIQNNGNVGIGTTSPSDSLDVNGAIGLTTTTATKPLNGIYSPAANQLAVTTSGATALTITTTGSVGIGTTAPAAALSVNGTGQVATFGGSTLANEYITIRPGGVGAAYFGLNSASYGSDNGFAQIEGGASKGIGFVVNNDTYGTAPSMYINSSANVGIGTTVPAAKLDVVGSIYSRSVNAVAATTINWASGNEQYTTASCGAFSFSGMQDGGSYTLFVEGTTSGTCSFSNSDSPTLTFKLPSNHGATTASTMTLYHFVRVGTYAVVTWMPGY